MRIFQATSAFLMNRRVGKPAHTVKQVCQVGSDRTEARFVRRVGEKVGNVWMMPSGGVSDRNEEKKS